MQLELSDAERDALARFLRSAIDTDRYPLSPRLAPLKAILAKLARSGQSVGNADKLDPKPQAQPPLPKPGPPRAASPSLNSRAYS